jgi:dolichyl-phosphate-mannose-protein mannosyltransferase
VTAGQEAVHAARPQARVEGVEWTATWVVLGAIVLGSTLARCALAFLGPAPWILPDELIYAELGRSLVESGGFLLREEPFSALSFGPLYPIVTAPAYLLPMPAAYLTVKLLNALLFSTAAIPAYLLAGRLLSRRLALTAAALAVAIPSGVYTTKVMTESVAYPAFLLAVLAMTIAFERPRARTQLAVLAAIGLAVLARAQMIVLLPAFVTAIVLISVVHVPRADVAGRLRRFKATWIALGLLVAAAAAVAVLRGAELLGRRSDLLEQIRPFAFPRMLLYHAAELDLYLAVIPVVAAVAAVRAAFAGDASPQLRTFGILLASVSAWLFALVAVFATRPEPVLQLFDRYLFYLVPLALIALLAFPEIRPHVRRNFLIGVAAVAALIPLTLPFDELLDGRVWGTSSSSVGLVLWYGVKSALTSWVFLAFVATFTALMALRAVRVTTLRGLVVPVLATFVASGLVAQVRGDAVARRIESLAVPSNPNWIDEAVGTGKAITIWGRGESPAEAPYFAFLQAEFFNGRIGRAYHLGAPTRADLPSTRLVVRARRLVLEDGTPLAARYVVTDSYLPLVGPVVARDRRSGLLLYEFAGPIRVPDSWAP